MNWNCRQSHPCPSFHPSSPHHPIITPFSNILKPDYYEQTAVGVLTCRDYGVVAVKGDVVILKRDADFERGLAKLGVEGWKLVAQGNRLDEQSLERAVREAWERLREGGAWQGDEHFGRLP
jgi:hypothetical protein